MALETVACLFSWGARTINAAVWAIFCVVQFWSKVATPPQNGAKQEMSL